MPKSLDQFLGSFLLGQVRSLLQLTVFLLQSVVKLGQFDLHIILDILLLVPDNLENLVFEFMFALSLQFFEFVKHGVHQWGQNSHVLSRHLLALLDVILNVPELLFEVVETLNTLRDLLFLALVLVDRPRSQTKHLCAVHGFLRVIHALEFGLGYLYLLRNAILAQRLLLEHHYGRREVLLTKVHLHCVGEERLHRHLRLCASFFTSFTWHLAITWSSGHGRLCHPRISLLGLINHFLADSSARFSRLLAKCREFLRV